MSDNLSYEQFVNEAAVESKDDSESTLEDKLLNSWLFILMFGKALGLQCFDNVKYEQFASDVRNAILKLHTIQ